MGQVFLSRSPSGRLVAVKVVRPELADDAGFRSRFAAEVRAARKVGGFYTAQVVDADTTAEQPWLATAYIPGPSLHQAVAEHGSLPAASVAVLGAGLAEGLAAVHTQGLVHRDLKPANVILAADGPRLIDFGIARALDATSYTQTRAVLGTPAFMSPEQAVGDSADRSSDVFSLGCVLAFAATGRSPFGTGPPHALTYRIVHADPDLSGLSAPLADLVERCLAKDPAARPGVDVILAELTRLAPLDQNGDGRPWLPEALTQTIQRQTRVLTQIDPAGTPAHGRNKPRERGQEPADFELITAAMRTTNMAKRVLGGLGLLALGFAGLTLVSVIVDSQHRVPNSLAFASAVIFSRLLGPLWALAVVGSLCDGGSNGHDLLKVDPDGLNVVDNRWMPWGNRSFFLAWDRLESIVVTTEPTGSSRLIAVTFKDGRQPEMGWARKHGVPERDHRHIVATISARNAERTAMVPRVREALARFGGSVYSEERPVPTDTT
jgi:hypothetical protein